MYYSKYVAYFKKCEIFTVIIMVNIYILGRLQTLTLTFELTIPAVFILSFSF